MTDRLSNPTGVPGPRGAVRKAVPTVTERRARLRLGGSWLVTLGMVAVVGYGLWWFSRPHVSPIRDVQVHGQFQYLNGKDIEIAVKPFLPDGFFGLNMNALKTALAQVPWIESAELRRVWPGRLVVTLRERTALAQWMSGGYVSTEGVHFTPERGPEGLVMLGGPDGSSADAATNFRELAPLVADAGLTLRELQTDARRAWRMRVERTRPGSDVGEIIELKLGGADLGDRLRRFTTVYAQRLAADERQLASADLRYTNGLAVRFAPTGAAPDTKG